MKQSKDFNLKVNYFTQLERSIKELQKAITQENYLDRKIGGNLYFMDNSRDQAEEENKRKKKIRKLKRDNNQGYSR